MKTYLTSLCLINKQPSSLNCIVKPTTNRHPSFLPCKNVKGSSDSFGRSMVEMLGVLAIVGILSAGALAGYSKAMFKHKMNQTIDTVSLVLQRLQELAQKDLGADFKIETAEDVVNYGLLENCQWSSADESCKLPMGALIFNSMPSYIYILFNSSKECVAFSSAHWENVLPLEWWNNRASLDIGGTGDVFFYKPSENINKTSVSEITDICEEQCEGGGGCYMEIGFGNIFR